MKLIILKFLTNKGRNAYYRAESEGKKQSWRDKKIASQIAKDIIISDDPLIVHIVIKMEWLAVQIELDKQTEIHLKKYGAVLNKDYIMTVE